METKYNHLLVEQNKEKKWRDNKYFSAHDNAKEPFSILLPPPNVTGQLHLGHAWDATMPDALIRYNKLKGKDVMWIAAMDHAGIATQAKVEERLAKQGTTRYELGRKDFIKKVWEWKDEYANIIRTQWQTLGLALDYDNERFTLDENVSAAVSNVFIDLYKRKLIYKGIRPINWDTKLQTVLSNIEVDNKDTKQNMYYIKYDIKNGGSISVATVRTETLYSDVAIAINPEDDKLSEFIGKTAIHPLTGKELPILEDDSIEIGKGTGAMKVSAHAEHDFDIIKKHNLELIESIDSNGMMNEYAKEFSGLDRFEAREKIVEKLKAKGRIEKVVETDSAVGYSSRSGVPIEILVKEQWFIKMKPMAEKILDDLNSESGIKFYPERFKSTLKRWMEEVHDWCISRQLWWGHRIPAWYKGDDVKVQVESPGPDWKQDDDVLDTWFSSGLSPFTFLGWPEKTDLLKRYYPSNVLVTGYDIIFFWVARMYFQSLDIMGQKPFNNVLIHGLIRAEDGKKMSKSLNNGIDPMDTIKQYGADALRWFLLINSTPGQDMRYSEEKLSSAWNLNNKLWNIARYILEVMPEGNNQKTDIDVWIESKLAELIINIEKRIESYEFTIIGKDITHFIMEDFSSWYVEMSKENPNQKFAKSILANLMIAIHPFMPFISDHIYHLATSKELLDNTWPILNGTSETKSIDLAINIVKEIRMFRDKQRISNKEAIKYSYSKKLNDIQLSIVQKLANAIWFENNDFVIPLGNEKIFVELSKDVKKASEKTKQYKILFLEAEIKRANEMLANENFVKKAPAHKIKEEKEKLEKYKTELETIKMQD